MYIQKFDALSSVWLSLREVGREDFATEMDYGISL